MKKQTQKSQNIRVIKNEEKPETPEILAQSFARRTNTLVRDKRV